MVLILITSKYVSAASSYIASWSKSISTFARITSLSTGAENERPENCPAFFTFRLFPKVGPACFLGWLSSPGICIIFHSQARSPHFYKGGHDDGGTKGPEQGAERRGGRVWGRYSHQKIFEKSTLIDIAHFPLVLPARYHSKVNRL